MLTIEAQGSCQPCDGSAVPGVVDLVDELLPDPSGRVLHHGIRVVNQGRGCHLLSRPKLCSQDEKVVLINRGKARVREDAG